MDYFHTSANVMGAGYRILQRSSVRGAKGHSTVAKSVSGNTGGKDIRRGVCRRD